MNGISGEPLTLARIRLVLAPHPQRQRSTRRRKAGTRPNRRRVAGPQKREVGVETRVEQTGRLGSVRARIGRAGGRWRRVARWTARVAVAAGLAYAVLLGVQEAYEYATSSPRFEVRGLRYQPTAHVDDLRLRELMALPPGTNILSLDLREIAERI